MLSAQTLTRKTASASGEFIEVRKLFESTIAGPAGIFSFENLCEALGIEPHRLLARIGIMTIGDLPSRRYQMRRHRAPLEPPQRTRHSSKQLVPLAPIVNAPQNSHRVAVVWNSPGASLKGEHLARTNREHQP